LYKLFGVNAELLIDHAWGYEPCTIENIKNYKPSSNSLSTGQVLHEPYNYKQAELIVREMIDLLSLDLVRKKLVTNQITLTINYDIECLENGAISRYYNGLVTTDFYGRNVPKPAHGTINLEHKTSSSKLLTDSVIKIYKEIVNEKLLIRKINISANNLVNEEQIKLQKNIYQVDLFSNYQEHEKEIKQRIEEEQKEKQIQQIMINIKNKYGKNAILKGMNYLEDATTRERNKQIGGHHE